MRQRTFATRPLAIGASLLVILGVIALLGWQTWGTLRFRAAEEALANRDFPRARVLVGQALRVWPNDSETLLLAAQAARRDGALDEAARILKTAERSHAVPDAVALERDLLRLQSGALEDADRFLEVCVAHPMAAQTPQILEAVIIGSLQRLELARAGRCLQLWEGACAREPDRVQGWIWRGELALRTGDVDTAARHYRQVVKANPANDKTRLRLAELLTKYAPREALEQLDQLRETPFKTREVLLHRARCYRSLGEHEQADQLLGEILAQSPADYEAILERGQIALELRQFDAAERWFRAAADIHPDRRDTNQALARCLQLTGKEEEAQRYRDKVTKIDALLDERVRQLQQKGRIEE